MRIITAVEPYQKKPGDVSIFLAGGIQNTKEWQKEVITSLQNVFGNIDNLVVLNPRRENFPIHDKNAAREQITWEYDTLHSADIFSMHFAGGISDQPICMYELGKHLERRFNNADLDRVVVSSEPDYKRVQDVKIQSRLVYPGIEIGNSSEEHIKKIISVIRIQLVLNRQGAYMGVFDGGVELERTVLKSLLSDESCCQINATKLKEDYFSSDARRFIFYEINKELLQNNCALSEQVLDNIITLQHGDEYVTFMGEKNLVVNAKPTKNINSVIRLLHEMWVGRETNACLESVAEMIGSGRFVDAAKLFRQKAFTIQIEQNIKKTKEFFSTIKERISKVRDKRDNPEKYRGLKTGFATFDLQTGGLFPGEMTLIAGITGLGKSTILKQIEYGLLLNNPGKNVLHIANEEYEEQVESKFDSVFTGIDYHSFKFARKEDVPEEVLRNWEIHIEKIAKKCKGKLYTKEVPAFSDVSIIRRAVHELKAEGIEIHAIFIDHLPNMKPVQPAYGENNEREKCAAGCKELARELHVPVVVPTQAATVVEEKQSKGKRASKLDVYGSKAQIHHANTFFIITYLGKDAKTVRSDGTPETLDYLRDVFILCDVKKNRDGATFTFKLRHHVRNGRMEEIEISPEIKKRFEEEMAKALKTGDFGTVILDEDPPKKEGKKDVTVIEAEGEHDEGF